MDEIVAHQRRVREHWRTIAPRPEPESLDGYTVEIITRAAAVPIIMRYEYLGSVGAASHFVGLFSPERELMGVAAFGGGPGGDIQPRIGGAALCLMRGACVHYAPANAASFLINRACKLVARLTEIEIFFAYADPHAGEYGSVYQSSGWLYLGQGIKHERKQNRQIERTHRLMVLSPGAEDIPANWKTTRELRRGKRLGVAAAREAGWRVEYREAKHVYATHVANDRRARRKWRKAIGEKPYPAPRPQLKRKAKI